MRFLYTLFLSTTTERFTYLNLVKYAERGLGLGSSKFMIQLQLSQKNDACFKGDQKRTKNNYPAIFVTHLMAYIKAMLLTGVIHQLCL